MYLESVLCYVGIVYYPRFRMPLHRVAWSHAAELNTQGPQTLVSSVLGLPIR
jgi:hypothetical protein